MNLKKACTRFESLGKPHYFSVLVYQILVASYFSFKS